LALAAQVEVILAQSPLLLVTQVEVILAQSPLLLVTQVEVLLALKVLLAQAVQVTQTVVDSLGVLLVSQVFSHGYTDRQLVKCYLTTYSDTVCLDIVRTSKSKSVFENRC